MSAAHPIRVTFFGDSTCVGQGVSIFRGWVPRIAQDLDELGRSLGHEILVTNASVNGRTTRQALEDMPYHVQGPGVDILVVQFGLNDCNYWATDGGAPRVSLAAFRANICEIIERGRRFGARRILLNNNHSTSRASKILAGTNITYEESNIIYNQAIRELATTQGPDVRFQDIENRFNDLVLSDGPLERYLLADGLHLSLEGHEAYFELMRPVLREAVEMFASGVADV
jgi:acyl-CoA thioesterase-1